MSVCFDVSMSGQADPVSLSDHYEDKSIQSAGAAGVWRADAVGIP